MAERLRNATSPYLRQHADNPVDWYPWGPEAFQRAREEQKPILLSVGYAACHWCHVMERESFSDPETAELMNRLFVNVKVDREERPDVDALYMKAVQAFTGGHGGWPMTVFLLPDGRPFLAGTYFPPVPRHGMPSFRQVLEHAARLWRERRQEVLKVADEVLAHLEGAYRLPRPADALGGGWLERLADALEEAWDERWGGFGGAPKFPHAYHLEALLVHHRRSGAEHALRMAEHTLAQVARGGMADLLGGGFCRYSVDARWAIPHFEKMLYDNALLAPVYAIAAHLTGREGFRRAAEGAVGWMLREMRLPGGGFASSLDADTEGEEGLTYTWTPDEIAAVLGPEMGRDAVARACGLLGVTDEGTFEHGRSVLRLPAPWDDLDPGDRAFLLEAFPLLHRARQGRLQPARDHKAVTAWNGMAAVALARCGILLERRDWVEEAAATVRFLLERATVDGRLRRVAGGDVPGFLDDHAWLVTALLELHQATLDPARLRQAEELCDRVLDLFLDRDSGVLATTGRDAEPLLVRGPEAVGGSEPAGQGVLAWALVRLAPLLGRDDLAELAERVLRQVQPLAERAPRALGPEHLAAAWVEGPTWEVGFVGELDDPALPPLLGVWRERWRPFAVAAWSRPGAPDAPPVVAQAPPGEGAVALVCRTGACLPPARDPEELRDRLAEVDRPVRPRTPRRPAAPELSEDPGRWVGGLRPELGPGRIVVIDFWTSCCINCMHLLPELARLEEAMADLPVQVVGVHSPKFDYEKDPAAVARAVERLEIRHPVLHDPDHATWRAFGIRAWPTVVIVDAQGREAWRRSGEVDAETLERVVRRLLEEEGVRPGAGVLAPPRAPAAAPLVHPAGLGLLRPGRDGGPDGARVVLADAGLHRVVDLELSLDEEGWPRAIVRRAWGAGVPGLLDGPGPMARFRHPQKATWDGQAIVVADTGNHVLRRIDPRSGEVTTLAGTGRRGPGGGGPDPLAVDLRSPWGLAAAEGLLFVSMAGAHQVWALVPGERRIGIVAGSGVEDRVDGPVEQAALAQPSGLALAGDELLVADSESSSIRAVDLRGRRVRTLVGGGLFTWGDEDGPLDRARLQHPVDLAVADGLVYVADTFNHKVRVLDRAAGTCRTLAGDPELLAEPAGILVLGPLLLVSATAAGRLVAVRRSDGAMRPVPVAEPESGGAW